MADLREDLIILLKTPPVTRSKNGGEVNIERLADQILAQYDLYVQFYEARIQKLEQDNEALKHSKPIYKLTNMEVRAETAREIFDWGDEPCPHSKLFTTKIGVPYSPREKRQCFECWQELKAKYLKEGE